MPIDQEIKKKIQKWIENPYDAKMGLLVKKLYEENETEAQDAFYKNLTFGTAGLRGLVGVGTNRLNKYTVAAASEALARYLKKNNIHKNKPEKSLSVFISYDSRHFSKEFAEEAAKVLSSHQIHVYLTETMRPTPLVSFGCRFKGTDAALMITASHNSKEYNGIKIYWEGGAPILPPHEIGIMKEMELIDPIELAKEKIPLTNPFIEYVGEPLDKPYIKAILELLFCKEDNSQFGYKLDYLYTSLHGTGITLFPEAAKNSGFSNINYVPLQCIPDGDFPHMKKPNPEEKEALFLGIKLLEESQKDLLVAHDPDADRVAIVVRHKGKSHVLSGNQIACLLLNHILKKLYETNQLPTRGSIVKTVVTSELLEKIAVRYQVDCFNVLPGFKYIAEKMGEWETTKKAPHFLFGAEDSYGYLFGTVNREKDAISTSLLILELALQAKLANKTLIDLLENIYKTYGCFVERVISLDFDETKKGREKISTLMGNLRKKPPQTICNLEVIKIEDYMSNLQLKTKSDLLIFWLEDGSKVCLRPSGTEPKIKIYGEVVVAKFENGESGLSEGEEKLDKLMGEMKRFF